MNLRHFKLLISFLPIGVNGTRKYQNVNVFKNYFLQFVLLLYSSKWPIYVTSCNHYHPTVIHYCPIGQRIGSSITEELQAVGPDLSTICMHQKNVDIACSVPLPDMRQATLRVHGNIELDICSISVGVRICVVGVV